MTISVLFWMFFSLSKILITFCSAMTSKFEVISSQTNISGCAKRERIIFNLCSCPPLTSWGNFVIRSVDKLNSIK